MRVIHLSDIHLSKDNIEEFRLYYRKTLVRELKERNFEKEIDLIIISGDLVDRGGYSLKDIDIYMGYSNPYDIFEKEFIDPLYSQLNITKEKILFISGNHDIQQDQIDEVIEAGLKSLSANSQEVNRLCNKYYNNLKGINIERLGAFLDFEERYHRNNSYLKYKFSQLESQAIYESNSFKIGIALINDSWRCGKGNVENHFVGINQFHRCLNFFEEHDTELNIAVMHHPLDCYNSQERDEIENLLHNKKFEILLLGHEHSKNYRVSSFGDDQKILYTRGRSAFDKPHEKETKYTSGYTTIDIDFLNKSINCHYKIYDKQSYKFNDDYTGGNCIKTHQYGIRHEVLIKVNDKGKDFFMGIDKSNFINNSDNE